MDTFHGFSREEIQSSFHWLNEPPKWGVQDGKLLIVAAPDTDLFCGSRANIRNEAAFLYRPIEGDFRFAAKLSAGTKKFADAGALLLRASDSIWCKLCLEQNEYGNQTIVSVATNGWSDDVNHQIWPLAPAFLRISRLGNEIALHVSADGLAWPLCRCLTLALPASVDIGFVAQSPFGQECEVEFGSWFVDNKVDADFRSGK